MGNKQSSPPPPPEPVEAYVPPEKDTSTPTKPKFDRETANLQLTVERTADCSSCQLTVDPTLSSATVILTRNILGKLDAPKDPAPSDSWVWDPYVKKDKDGVPTLAETSQQRDQRCGRRGTGSPGCIYIRADPSTHGKTIGRPIDASGAQHENDEGDLYDTFQDDLNHWKIDQASAKAKNRTPKKMVRIWNPSDDPDDIDGSQAINYTNHGALTKLYLKPTIPFQITFDPTGMTPIKPPSVQKVYSTNSKKLETPSTAPTVRGPPTL